MFITEQLLSKNQSSSESLKKYIYNTAQCYTGGIFSYTLIKLNNVMTLKNT